MPQIGTNQRYAVDYVELETLKEYLSKQYAGMGGNEIANHRHFCRNGPGRSTLTLVEADGLADYLAEQYEGMGGADIASHRYFLRSCPTLTVSVRD